MRCVSTRPPYLVPIFRSETQLDILGATYLEPEREFTVPELVAHSSRPQPTVAREIERLADAGLLESELRSGRRVVRAATGSPIYAELQALLLKTIGPKAVIERVFGEVAGIERAFIYGSWAHRYAGEAGPVPQDIDVMVIGSDVLSAARKAGDKASAQLGRDVNVTVLSPEEWRTAKSGFVQQVKDRPKVDLEFFR